MHRHKPLVQLPVWKLLSDLLQFGDKQRAVMALADKRFSLVGAKEAMPILLLNVWRPLAGDGPIFPKRFFLDGLAEFVSVFCGCCAAVCVSNPNAWFDGRFIGVSNLRKGSGWQVASVGIQNGLYGFRIGRPIFTRKGVPLGPKS